MFLIQSADLSNIFGCDLEQNQTGVIMKEKKATLSSVFLRHYEKRFSNDL